MIWHYILQVKRNSLKIVVSFKEFTWTLQFPILLHFVLRQRLSFCSLTQKWHASLWSRIYSSSLAEIKEFAVSERVLCFCSVNALIAAARGSLTGAQRGCSFKSALCVIRRGWERAAHCVLVARFNFWWGSRVLRFAPVGRLIANCAAKTRTKFMQEISADIARRCCAGPNGS
jgi:hypothetical protein